MIKIGINTYKYLLNCLGTSNYGTCYDSPSLREERPACR